MMMFGQQGTCSVCPAVATIVEGDGFSPDRLVCDSHSRWRNPALPLPMGYHGRTLGYPACAPYSTGTVVYPGTNPVMPGLTPG